MKPFLHWAGGKRQLIEEIENNLPNEIAEIGTYVEPFLGAGSIFFHMIKNYNFNSVIINDINSKLMCVYRDIRDNLEELIVVLEGLSTSFLKKNKEEREAMYYNIRNKYNKNEENPISISAMFIFLNKTCFNGLYRENSKGLFNVPVGSYRNPKFYAESQLTMISNLLNTKNSQGERLIKILNKTFLELKGLIDGNSFVYLDPPYRPVTKGGFNSYNKSKFGDKMQKKLAEFYTSLDNKGAKLLLSNSDPKNLDENDLFFDKLYESYNIKRVFAKRSINSNKNKRGSITELLIKNYGDTQTSILKK